MAPPPESLDDLLARIRACRECRGLPLGPRPVIQAGRTARVALIGHAPGRLVHASGVPWDDASDEHQRLWLGMDREEFYDPARVALFGMGLCYPGTGRTGDLPPRPECAPLWHDEILARLRPGIRKVLIGRYAIDRYLGKRRKATLTETVRAWREYRPFLVLPHPSGRNNGWLAKNPWFARDLPAMRRSLRDTA